MLSINEINKEIEKLENCEYTTYGTCQKLALLYIVRDHYEPEIKQEMSSMKDAGIGAMMMHNTTPPASLR